MIEMESAPSIRLVPRNGERPSTRWHYMLILHVTGPGFQRMDNIGAELPAPLTDFRQVQAIQADLATKFRMSDGKSGAQIIGAGVRVVITGWQLLRSE